MKNRQMAIGLRNPGGDFAEKNAGDNAQNHPYRKKTFKNTCHFTVIVQRVIITHL